MIKIISGSCSIRHFIHYMKYVVRWIHMKKRVQKSKYTTIMLIPDSTQKIKSLQIPNWIWHPMWICICVLIIALLTSSLRISTYQVQVNGFGQELKNRIELNSTLKSQNQLFDHELQKLQMQYNELEQKLDVLEKYKEQLDEKLEQTAPTSKKHSSQAIQSSRSSFLVIKNNLPSKNFLENSTALSIHFTQLDDLITKELKAYQALSQRIDKALPYLSAYPTGWPAQGKITSEMAIRKNPFTGRGRELHTGIDIAVSHGTEVLATGEGVILFSGYQGSYGRLIIIDHGFGFTTRYAHNSSLLVKEGDFVKRGDVIAKSGSSGRSTGPHLHYEVRIHDEPQNPRDYLGEETP